MTRRDSWAAAFQAGGCHHTMLDELLLGERKFLTNMQVGGDGENVYRRVTVPLLVGAPSAREYKKGKKEEVVASVLLQQYVAVCCFVLLSTLCVVRAYFFSLSVSLFCVVYINICIYQLVCEARFKKGPSKIQFCVVCGLCSEISVPAAIGMCC